MKKIIFVLVVALLFVGCSAKRMHVQPNSSDVPSNFTYVSDEGNGYYKYQSPDGFYLVSTQIQGQIQAFSSNRFIDIVYIGK